VSVSVMIALADSEALHSADSVARRRMFLAQGYCINPGLAEEPVQRLPGETERERCLASTAMSYDQYGGRARSCSDCSGASRFELKRRWAASSFFRFRFRDPVTGKWTRARYKAERQRLRSGTRITKSSDRRKYAMAIRTHHASRHM
jgi:hypothetical protein